MKIFLVDILIEHLLMKGICYAIGEFHANKTMKNSKNPILRVFLMRRGAYFFV